MVAIGSPLAILLAIALVLNSVASPLPASAQPRGPDLAGFTSAKFDMEYRLETENLALYVPGTGAFVVDPKTGSSRFMLMLTAFGESLELRVIDGTVYLKSSTSTDWEQMPSGGSSSTAMPPPGAVAAMVPPAQLAALQRAVVIVPITTEEIDGVDTTRWSIDIDTPAVLEVFGAFTRMAGSRSSSAASLTGDADIDQLLRSAKLSGLLWVENETGYLKQVQMDLYLNIPTRFDQATRSSKQVALHQQLLTRFRAHDQPVDIAIPAGLPPPTRPTPRTGTPVPAPRQATPTPTRTP